MTFRTPLAVEIITFLQKSLLGLIGLGILVPPQMGMAIAAMSHPSAADPAREYAARQEALKDLSTQPIEEFLAQPLPPDMLAMTGVPRGDSTIDQDPFFLRSQRWTNRKNLKGEASEALNPGHYVVVPGQKNRALQLDQNLRPIFYSDKFVVLAANDAALFEKAAPSTADEIAGQGLFVIDTAELQTASLISKPVPVYFFPLPEGNWTSTDIKAFEMGGANAIAINDADGEVLPINLDDVATAVMIGKSNFSVAMSFAYDSQIESAKAAQLDKNPELVKAFRDLQSMAQKSESDAVVSSADWLKSSAKLGEALGLANILPARGSTAGFGLILTGFDLENPKSDVLRSASNSSSPGSALRRAFDNLIGVPASYADADPNPEPAPSASENPGAKKLKAVFLRVGIVCTASLGAAIVFKYLFFQEHFREMNAKREKRKNPLVQEIKDIGDVYAHNLAFLAQVTPVWFGRSVEYIADHYFYSLAAGKNKLVRRLLAWTILQTARSNERTPVNAGTWFKGSIVVGGIDTLCVWYQSFHTVPAIGHAIAGHFPSERERVTEAFGDPNTPPSANTVQLQTYSVAYNAAAYLTRGAVDFSVQMKSQYLPQIEADVREQMEREQIDPDNEKNAAEKERRIEEGVRVVFNKMGLPQDENFVYDASTLWTNFARMLGVQNAQLVLQNKSAEKEANAFETKIVADEAAPAPELVAGAPVGINWGLQRTGLISPSIKLAVKEARRQLVKFPNDQDLVNAVKVLEASASRIDFLRPFVFSPIETFRRINAEGLQNLYAISREVKQDLIAISFDGSANDKLPYLPESWLKVVGRPGTSLAGKFYRRALFHLISGNKEVLSGPSDIRMDRLGPQVVEAAEATLAANHPEETREYFDRYTPNWPEEQKRSALNDLKSNHPTEFSLIQGDLITAKVRNDEAEKIQYQAVVRDGSFYKRAQLWNIRRKTNRLYQLEMKQRYDGDYANDFEAKVWRNIYVKTFANSLGLQLDFNSMPRQLAEKIWNAAESNLAKQLRDPAVKACLGGQPQGARNEEIAILDAQNLIPEYLNRTEGAIEKGELSALSPAQPGRLQSLRQTKIFRGSKILTGLARVTESVFRYDTNVKIGLAPSISRNIPFVGDFAFGNKQVLRRLPTAALAGYWFNYFMWNMHQTLPQWVFGWATAWCIWVPMLAIGRATTSLGVKPYKNIKTTIAYGLVYTWLTFGGSLVQMYYQSDFDRGYQAHVAPIVNPVIGAGSKVIDTVVHPVNALGNAKRACERVLSGD